MHDMRRSRPVEILLVEDNPADVELTLEALADGKLLNHVSVAKDGMEAMAFLRREVGYEKSPRPDLILLDLNLPRKNGFEVLEEVKGDAGLASIPVVVLTTSNADRDVVKSYDLKANCYVCKPVELDEFLSFVRSTQEFWLEIVHLPPVVAGG
jgi:two-component system, chemotaxis family, response regulator Rcp1